MEFILLYKIGVVVDIVVKAGYTLAGVYVLRTGVKYVKDYKYYAEKEKAEVK